MKLMLSEILKIFLIVILAHHTSAFNPAGSTSASFPLISYQNHFQHQRQFISNTNPVSFGNIFHKKYSALVSARTAVQGRDVCRSTSLLSQMTEHYSCDDVTTLPQYLEQQNIDVELSMVICQAAISCIEISRHLATLPIDSFLQDGQNAESAKTNVQGERQKPMDVIANNIFIKNLQSHTGALASEEEEAIILGSDLFNGTQHKYEIAFDPLDGSSNLD
eukprot:scaffold1646_cov210-Chaetoceros_neogracile.AAC.2